MHPIPALTIQLKCCLAPCLNNMWRALWAGQGRAGHSRAGQACETVGSIPGSATDMTTCMGASIENSSVFVEAEHSRVVYESLTYGQQALGDVLKIRCSGTKGKLMWQVDL